MPELKRGSLADTSRGKFNGPSLAPASGFGGMAEVEGICSGCAPGEAFARPPVPELLVMRYRYFILLSRACYKIYIMCLQFVFLIFCIALAREKE